MTLLATHFSLVIGAWRLRVRIDLDQPRESELADAPAPAPAPTAAPAYMLHPDWPAPR
ncbi:MAG TPA: hypothetical protein VMD91_11115 [Candidatus Sulfotelmatobacter sp.]|nr:hypothetical protein [Candidatus Sulfotelmatobacter sp.]